MLVMDKSRTKIRFDSLDDEQAENMSLDREASRNKSL